jgi:hypothetical protein
MANKAILVQAGDGTAIPSNMVGEVVTSTKVQVSGTSSVGSTTGTFAGITKGVWRFDFKTTIINSSGSITSAQFITQLTTNNALNPTIGDYYFNAVEVSCGCNVVLANPSNDISDQRSMSVTIQVLADTTYYLRSAYSVAGGGSIGLVAYGQATRIAYPHPTSKTKDLLRRTYNAISNKHTNVSG